MNDNDGDRKVVPLDRPASEVPVRRVLQCAGDADITKVVVIGECADGSDYFAASTSNAEWVLWAVERFKLGLMTGFEGFTEVDDEPA